jgi:ABC transport system ATP-binding/permease protein
MPQITIQDLTISYRGPELLSGVSCRIEPGERIGLLGRNGSGKTTLMRLISGEEIPDEGKIELSPGTRVAILPQDVPASIAGKVSEVIGHGLPASMTDVENHWKGEQLVERTLTRMALDGEADFLSLSTGMKRRVLLGQAIVGEPDVLLLDEPTNHLDIDAIQWLEGFLNSLPATLVFVTHDRAFLTRLAQRILEIDRGKLFDWVCDYPTFLTRKEQALLAEEKQNALFDKRLAEEEVWIRTGIKARRTRNEGRVRALEAMRNERAKRRKVDGNVKLQMDTGERSGMLVCSLQGASFGYDNRVIVPQLDLTIMRGDKIGIIGRNGTGKSTLLKGLLGELKPMEGQVKLGTKLEIAYFDQTRDILDPDKTAEENVSPDKSTVFVGGRSRHIIGYLQDFLFTPEQIRSPIRKFSGGQRNRLLLAKLFARSANLLVMDEPTNDLDTETLELLEERLVEYEGTSIIVSHDRAFLNNVVTSTIVFEPEGIKEYVGGYDDWVRQRSAKEPSSQRSDQSGPRNRNLTNENAIFEREVTSKTFRKLNFKEKIELEKLPGLIERYESEQADLHTRMTDPDYFKQSPAVLSKDRNRLAELEALLITAYSRLEELLAAAN